MEHPEFISIQYVDNYRSTVQILQSLFMGAAAIVPEFHFIVGNRISLHRRYVSDVVVRAVDRGSFVSLQFT